MGILLGVSEMGITQCDDTSVMVSLSGRVSLNVRVSLSVMGILLGVSGFRV